MRAVIAVLTALLVGGLAAGCAEEEIDREDAIEAFEANEVALDGVAYRVIMFRELNVRAPRVDGGLWVGPPPPPGQGYYAAFLSACNPSEQVQLPTEEIHLENAFGQEFLPLPLAYIADGLGYDPQPLEPDDCMPADGTVTDEALPGALVVFAIDFDVAQERPLVLVIGEGGEPGEVRVELDL